MPDNTLVVLPTWKGQYSYRNKEGASWLEESLFKIVEQEKCGDINVFHLLTKLNLCLSYKTSRGPGAPSADGDEAASGMKNTAVILHNLQEVVYFQKRK